MKRFLAICIIIFVVVVGSMEGVFQHSAKKKELNYLTQIKQKDILIKQQNEFKNLKLTGINLNSAKPGMFPGESGISEDEYYSWIEAMANMNINCIRVSNLMQNTFYKALKRFNESREKPIYIFQGIWFDEIDLKDGYDLQKESLEKKFRKEIRKVINATHGNPYKSIPEDKSKIYITDVSDYVLGYTLGLEWAPHDMIFSEIMNKEEVYEGTYFETKEGASSFESYLAKMADYTVDYEYKNYKKQTMISLIASPYSVVDSISTVLDQGIEATDNTYLNYKNYLDVENIKTTDKFLAGLVASYNIYPSITAMKEHKENLSEVITSINNYHSIPVIISEYGIPSSRLVADFATDLSKGYITETEQGEILTNIYKEIKEANCAGSFVFEWQDSWHRSSWNTKDNVILDKSAYFSDKQTFAQSYGLLSFEPGEKEEAIYVDGDIFEWSEMDKFSENNEINLSVKSDEENLYFMVKGVNNFNINDKRIFLDVDVTPKSGSNINTEYGLSFENPVDFIIDLNGSDTSKVLVQKYYSTYEFLEDELRLKIRPDTVRYSKDTAEFVDIKAVTSPKVYIKSRGQFIDSISYETGVLVHGNGNPNNQEFNSAADFYIGDNVIELKIPWTLLNFMDPSTKKVHNDYFEKLDIEPLDINNINIGLTIEDNYEKVRLKSKSYFWDEWAKPKYHERLKKSYYLLMDAFKEEGY